MFVSSLHHHRTAAVYAWLVGWVAVANDLAPLSQSLFAPAAAAQYTQLASSIAKCQGTEKPKKESYKMYYLFSAEAVNLSSSMLQQIV